MHPMSRRRFFSLTPLLAVPMLPKAPEVKGSAAIGLPEQTGLKNCLVKVRPSESGPLFWVSNDHGVQCNLNGYAIVPIEDFTKSEISGLRFKP